MGSCVSYLRRRLSRDDAAEAAERGAGSGEDFAQLGVDELVTAGIAEAQLALGARSQKKKDYHSLCAREYLTAALRKGDPHLQVHLNAVLTKLGGPLESGGAGVSSGGAAPGGRTAGGGVLGGGGGGDGQTLGGGVLGTGTLHGGAGERTPGASGHDGGGVHVGETEVRDGEGLDSDDADTNSSDSAASVQYQQLREMYRRYRPVIEERSPIVQQVQQSWQ